MQGPTVQGLLEPVSSTSAIFLGPVSDPKLLIMNFFKVVLL